MARYIDADAVISHMNARYDDLLDEYGRADHYASGYEEAIDLIEEAPTADVAEVKHGYSISKMHYSDEFICSECGLIMRDCCRYVIDEDADGDESCYGFEFRYCPHCGAKMDGGEVK